MGTDTYSNLAVCIYQFICFMNLYIPICMLSGGGRGHHRVRALRFQPPSLVVSSTAQLPCVASSTLLLLSALSSFCFNWLVVACHVASVAGIFAIVALAQMPSLHWHCCHCCAGIFAKPLLPLPMSIAAIKCRHQSPLPTATSIVECHLPLAIVLPVVHGPRRMLPRCHCHQMPLPPPPPPPPPAAAAAGPQLPSPPSPFSNSPSYIAGGRWAKPAAMVGVCSC